MSTLIRARCELALFWQIGPTTTVATSSSDPGPALYRIRHSNSIKTTLVVAVERFGRRRDKLATARGGAQNYYSNRLPATSAASNLPAKPGRLEARGGRGSQEGERPNQSAESIQLRSRRAVITLDWRQVCRGRGGCCCCCCFWPKSRPANESVQQSAQCRINELCFSSVSGWLALDTFSVFELLPLVVWNSFPIDSD